MNTEPEHAVHRETSGTRVLVIGGLVMTGATVLLAGLFLLALSAGDESALTFLGIGFVTFLGAVLFWVLAGFSALFAEVGQRSASRDRQDTP